MRIERVFWFWVFLSVLTFSTPAFALVGAIDEGFEDTGNPGWQTPPGWTTSNQSTAVGLTDVFQGDTNRFSAFDGTPTSYAGMNFNATANTAGADTISLWLITPPIRVGNGGSWSFHTRTQSVVQFPDRLEVRFSDNGTTCSPGTGPASVGDFTHLLTTINPSLTLVGYPTVWTKYQGLFSGAASSGIGCLAFRYFVTNGGPAGVNSDYIGIDRVTYEGGSIFADDFEDSSYCNWSAISGGPLCG